MKTIRNKVFETNSSSTHSLIMDDTPNDSYVPESNKIIINFIDTNDERVLYTLRDKVSYLVSHIVDKYKYDCIDYTDLIEQVSNNYGFQRIKQFVKEKFNKDIVFPKTYSGDIEDIVNINHQLICSNLDDLLRELVEYQFDYLQMVLSNNSVIEIGHD